MKDGKKKCHMVIALAVVCVMIIQMLAVITAGAAETEMDKNSMNNDILAYLSWGTDDGTYLTELWRTQNGDGGFGLSSEYTSDCYDTLLALMAAAEGIVYLHIYPVDNAGNVGNIGRHDKNIAKGNLYTGNLL